jgi:hypothetical protein
VQLLTAPQQFSVAFQARLQYFARCTQAYVKKLREFVSKLTPAEQRKDENKLKAVALRCTSNITALTRDLFHVPPIYKAKVEPSWKQPKTETANKVKGLISRVHLMRRHL